MEKYGLVVILTLSFYLSYLFISSLYWLVFAIFIYHVMCVRLKGWSPTYGGL